MPEYQIRGDLAELPDSTLTAVMSEVQAAEIAPTDGQLPLVADVLAASGVVSSKSAARRAIAEGGAYLNNQKVTDVEARLTNDDLLAGRWVLLRRGKRTVGSVKLVG